MTEAASGSAPDAASASTTTSPGTGSSAGAAPVSAGAPAAGAPASTSTATTPAAAPAADGGAAPAADAKTAAPAKADSLLASAAEPKSPTGEPNDQKPATDPAKAASEPAPYDLKLPDGVKITDEKQFGEFKTALQKAGVDPAKAPEIVSYIASQKDALEQAASQKQVDAWKETNKGWENDNFKNFDVKDKAAFQALDSYKNFGNMLREFGKDNPDLLSALDYTGAGNHPAIVKFLFNIADAVKEGGYAVTGKNSNAGKPKTKAGTLYDNQGA